MSARTAAIVAAIGYLVIGGFQVALALGAPLGHAAWGGKHRVLPTRFRVASGVAAGIWILGAVIVLGRAGWDISPFSNTVERWGTWVFVGLLAVGTLMNAASSSRWERFSGRRSRRSSPSSRGWSRRAEGHDPRLSRPPAPTSTGPAELDVLQARSSRSHVQSVPAGSDVLKLRVHVCSRNG